MKVSELLTDESKWIKDYLAKTAEGVECEINAPEASSWCIYAAFLKCYPREGHAKFRQLETSLGFDLVEWNNDPKRTFAEIRELVLKADV